MQAPRRGPGRVWYGVAAGLLVGGLVVAGVLAARGIAGVRSLGEAYVRAVMPGAAPFTVTETGKYTLFHEYRGTVDGTVYNNPQEPSGLQCLVVSRQLDRSTAPTVRLSPTGTNLTYTLGSRSGVSVAEFTIEQAGEYLLTCAYGGGRNEPRVVMVVGRPEGFVQGILSILSAVGVGLLAMIAAIVIFAVVLIKRRNANRPPPPPFGPYPGYAPAPGFGQGPGFGPAPGYGQPPQGYGAPPPGDPPPQHGYGAPPPGTGTPPGGYAPRPDTGPPPGRYPPPPPGAPPPGYGPPGPRA